MKSHFILHIGPHKTGTTSIQKFLSVNRHRLLERGVDFPVFGRHQNPSLAQAHRHFSSLIRANNETPPDFIRTLASWTPEKPICILSSEDFWYCSEPTCVSRALDRFGAHSTIICYLRDPTKHIVSMYKETLKGANAAEFGDFLKFHTARLTPSKSKIRSASEWSYYAYEENIAAWKQKFDCVLTKIYSEGTDASAAFLTDCGLAIETTELENPPRQNVSFSDSVTLILGRLNAMLSEERIDRKKYKNSRDSVICNSRLIAREFAGKIETTEFDLSDFLDRFERQNPTIKTLFRPLPESIKLPARLTASDTEILDALSKLVAMEPQS